MKKGLIVVALIVVFTAFYFRSQRRTATPTRAAETATHAAQSEAPALTLTDLDGAQINTASYTGKVVLVNFWAAWCTPCTAEVPQIMALQEKYRAEGLQVLGISMDDRESALRDFYKQHKMNYPVVAGNQQIAEAYGGILGLPTTILIARDGRMHAKEPGIADIPKLDQEISALLSAR